MREKGRKGEKERDNEGGGMEVRERRSEDGRYRVREEVGKE